MILIEAGKLFRKIQSINPFSEKAKAIKKGLAAAWQTMEDHHASEVVYRLAGTLEAIHHNDVPHDDISRLSPKAAGIFERAAKLPPVLVEAGEITEPPVAYYVVWFNRQPNITPTIEVPTDFVSSAVKLEARKGGDMRVLNSDSKKGGFLPTEALPGYQDLVWKNPLRPWSEPATIQEYLLRALALAAENATPIAYNR